MPFFCLIRNRTRSWITAHISSLFSNSHGMTETKWQFSQDETESLTCRFSPWPSITVLNYLFSFPGRLQDRKLQGWGGEVGGRRVKRSGKGSHGACSSPFPLNFPFSLVFPRGNLFTVNTPLMSRKDSKCQWDRKKLRGRQGRGSWENSRGDGGLRSLSLGRDKQSSRTSLTYKHKNTHAADFNSLGSLSGHCGVILGSTDAERVTNKPDMRMKCVKSVGILLQVFVFIPGFLKEF